MAIILNCVVIYLTATRGAILSGIAGLIIFISIPVYTSGFRKLKRTLGLLFVMFIITVGILLIFIDTELIKDDLTLSRFASMLTSDSVKNRFDLWTMAWNGIKIKPILGWGQENFIGIYTVNPITSMGSHLWMDRAHNIVIEWLTNGGILGLFSYLAIFGSAFFVLRKAVRAKVLSRGETEIIIIALVVYFIQNLFTFDTINTYMIFFALLAYIDNCMFNDKQLYSASKNSNDINKTKRYISATLAALLCFSFIGYYINYKPINQSRQIVRSRFSSPENDSYSVLLGEFNHALSFNTFGDFDVRRSMISVSDQIIKIQYFDQEGALKFIQATVNELRKEIAIRDYDLEFMTIVITLFNNIAFYEPSFIERSEKLIQKIKLINPEYLMLNMFMADVNILQKDYESAFTNVKKVVDQNPGKVENQLKLALMAIYASREDDVKEALENIKKIRISKSENIVSGRKPFLALVELHQLAQVYREMKHYTKALQHLQEIIDIVSEEKMYFDQDTRYYIPRTKSQMRSKIHVELAEMYLELNERSRALKEIEKAVIINPNISGDVKSLIDSINN
jgi:tetratricopeptide (TPR) repeat protein